MAGRRSQQGLSGPPYLPIRGEPVTEALKMPAHLLAKVLGTTAEFWLNLQLVNDLWLAEHNQVLAEKLKRARHDSVEDPTP